MVLPEGFVLPPWYLLVAILVVLGGVLAMLWALEPPVTDRTVVAFVPWMMFGSALHVLHQLGAYPEDIAVLFTSPGVYLVTAIVGGLAWIVGILLEAAGLHRSTERFVGITGTGFFVIFAMFALQSGWAAGTFEPFWPVIAVVVSGVVTALAWLVLGLWFTDVAAITGMTGVVVVFGHVLDGVSTAIGYDVLGAGENVPLSQLLLEAGEALPTAEYVGGGWVFVAVKAVLALVILGLFKEYVEERPGEARTILALVAAVGLGPGVHNVLLFLVA